MILSPGASSDSSAGDDAAARKSVTSGWSEAQIKAFAKIRTEWDGYHFPATTDIPMLEVCGDCGRQRPTLDQLRIPARPNVEVCWIENASHSLAIERPQELAAVITAFIRRIETARRRLGCNRGPASR